MDMDVGEESSRFGSLPTTTSRNLSSSSSTFYSALQSPFFSPRSSTCRRSEVSKAELESESMDFRVDPISSGLVVPDSESLSKAKFAVSDMIRNPDTFIPFDCPKFDLASSSTGISGSTPYVWPREKYKKHSRSNLASYSKAPISISSTRLRSYDVFIGLHGSKPSLLRFANWVRAEMEVHGMSCFVSDRAKCRNSRKHRVIERAMDASSFGIVILTKKSFQNPYTVEELRFFSSKKNLVPIFFDLSPGDCLARDIVEKRGDLWEKHGGDLWVIYGGLEKEWKEAIEGLCYVDEWKLEAQNGNWRDCILKAVMLLATRLGRRSVVEHLTKWREKVEKDEFPFPRNENFIGRKKELSELEYILFGNIAGDSGRDYFELKARPRRKNLTVETCSKKGKEPILWKESEKEIEMQSIEFPLRYRRVKTRSGERYAKRKRTAKILYGKGIACVSGDSGIGKTELLLEFAYRHHQKYKMVLWIGGESRYIRQNYLNLGSFLEVDVGFGNFSSKSKIKNFEEQEEAAISRIRTELMRNVPFLLIIDNLECEKDWWDHKLVMDLLPRFGGETHIIISTRLPRVMNLEPLKLSYLSEAEAMCLMQGNLRDYSIAEIDVLRIIEEKVGRLTFGLSIIGAILSELPITPTRLLDTTNRMPVKDQSWSGREAHVFRRNTFLMQLFEVCFSIFDRADGPRSLATRMALASGWFGPAAIPLSQLTVAAHKILEKRQQTRLWRKLLACGFTSSYTKKSEAEATSVLLRFNMARSSTKQGCLQFNDLVKLYARKRGLNGAARAMVHAVMNRRSIIHHWEHMWAACFLLFGFGRDPVVVELKVSELLYLVKEAVLPLAIRTFLTFSQCTTALELLRLCTNALEAADQAFVTPVEKWLDKSLCWRPIQTNAQLNPYLWQELALCRATLLETRARLMLRGGQFDIGDDLIRKAIFIRTSISGDDHPDTISAHETLSKLNRLIAHFHTHSSP